jgi:hypothetical protein
MSGLSKIVAIRFNVRQYKDVLVNVGNTYVISKIAELGLGVAAVLGFSVVVR